MKTRLKEVGRSLRARYFPVQDFVIGSFGRTIRRRSVIRERLPASDPLSDSKDVAVYVHFDKQGAVHDYVVHQLRELVTAGFRITFVSNSPTLSDQSLTRIFPFCKEVIWRFNIGYDFGAYKDGVLSIDRWEGLDSLLLMNDSIYGPFWSLRDPLSKIDRSKTDFWGITDSWEYQHHIQTFFILFFPKALQSSAFKSFWTSLPYINHKRWVIRNGEVRLSQVLERVGLRSNVLAPYWSVAATMKEQISATETIELRSIETSQFEHFRSRVLSNQAINPMQYFWDVLIADYDCPFVKRELIWANPANIPSAGRWPAIIRRHSNYDVTMIERHLKR